MSLLSNAILRLSLSRSALTAVTTMRMTAAAAAHQKQQQSSYAPFFSTTTTTTTDNTTTTTTATTASSSNKPVVLRMDDLVKTVAEAHELSQAESRRIIDTIVDTITDALSENKKVALSSFGSFSTYTAKQRNCKNPRTGADITVPSKERVRFKAYTSLKKIVEHQPTTK